VNSPFAKEPNMSSQAPQNPRAAVLVMQIINGALVMGVVVFLAFVILTTQNQQPQPPRGTYYALGFLTIGIIISLAIRMPINRHLLKQASQEKVFDPYSDKVFFALAPIYQTERIIKLAIIEGGAFYNIVTYMQEGVWWSLAAAGLALALMLVGFPTRATINAWIERRTLGLQFGDSEL
jgi:hypothetical protein